MNKLVVKLYKTLLLVLISSTFVLGFSATTGSGLMELSCANKVTNDINSESSDGSSGVKAALVGEIQLGEKLIPF